MSVDKFEKQKENLTPESGFNLVGIDSPSIDLGSESSFSVHKILAQNDILIVENLANLEKISKLEFEYIILPLKLKDATGSPVRAVANY